MCAMYRMAVQGWPREAAIREMTEGGFGFHAVWDNLIEFLKKVDVDAIRRKAGIAHGVPNAVSFGAERVNLPSAILTDSAPAASASSVSPEGPPGAANKKPNVEH
jgi:hypothetical protein